MQITLSVTPECFAEDHETALDAIMAIDKRRASEDFTISVLLALLKSLESDMTREEIDELLIARS